MSDYTISIFGNKIFSEILNEIKLFSKFKIDFHENLDLWLKKITQKNELAVIFTYEENKDFNDKIKNINLPIILVNKFKINKEILPGSLIDNISTPFSILEFEKKLNLLVAKNEFKKNSLIKLNNYIIDKNERKIKKDNLELQLSEKEVNFLILFSNNQNPITKNFVLKYIWNYSTESETHTVETHVHRLRKKISQKFGDNNFIKNNNKGYYI